MKNNKDTIIFKTILEFEKDTPQKKDNSKKSDMFLNCRSCKQTITNDYRSKFDQRYCADCL